MNYVEFYPGDYMRDTAHLSLTEHGAYVLLLLHYYATEKPLPNDNPTLFRIARSMGETEKEAVIKVADEFFPVDPTDGLRHSARADRETLKARARVESARENGRKGGRPPKPTNNPTLSDSLTQPLTQTVTGSKALHTPHAIEDQKQKQPPATPAARVEIDLPSWVSAEAWDGFTAMRRKQRHPLTDRASRLILKKLESLRSDGQDASAVLDQSTRNGWRDVFPVKAGPANSALRNDALRNYAGGETLDELMARAV